MLLLFRFSPDPEFMAYRLASEKLRRPGTKWDELSQPIKNRLILEELTPKDYIIDSDSNFMLRWDFIMLFALIFVAFVTPYEVAFLPVNKTFHSMAVSPMFADLFI